MRHFIYIISDFTKRNIHFGYCSDVVKTVEIYNTMNTMSLHYPAENYLNRLVYFEENGSEEKCLERLRQLMTLTVKEKREMIIEINPEWIDLTKDVNFNEAVSA